MLGRNLLVTYRRMVGVGLARSGRDFSKRWLGRGKTYVRDFEHRAGRDNVVVPDRTVLFLRDRLCRVAAKLPAPLASEIRAIVAEIDHARAIAAFVGR